MTDLPNSLFKRYGIFSVIVALCMSAIIWGLAHFTAAPGTEVTILWGFVKYTKQDSPRKPGTEKIDLASLQIAEAKKSQPVIVHAETQPIEPLVNDDASKEGAVKQSQWLPGSAKVGHKEPTADWRRNEDFLKAIERGDQAGVVSALNAGVNSNLCYPVGGKLRSALGLASSKGDSMIVRFLLNAGAIPDGPLQDQEPIREAVIGGQVANARLLIAAGASITGTIVAKQKWRENSTDHEAVIERPFLVYTAEQGNLDMVRLLIESGADIDEKDTTRGWDAYKAASGRGSGITDYILKKKYPNQ